MRASHGLTTGDFKCYSNTSDDALCLSGALADLGASLSQAKNAIFITGWKLSPTLHLPFFHENLQHALQAHHANDLDDAIKKYKAIIEDKKFTNTIEFIYSHYFLFIIALQDGKISEAENYLKICLENQPRNPQFQNAELFLLYFQNKLEEAAKKVDLSEDTLSTDATFFALCGDILSDIPEKQNEAEDNYNRALTENGECIHALRGLGKLYLKKEKQDKAADYFKQVLAYFPADAIANQQLAEIELAKNEIDGAKHYTENALRGGCNSASILNLYARICVKKIITADEENNLEQLTDLIHNALKKDRFNFLLTYYQAFILFKQGKIALAAEKLNTCAIINPVLLNEQLTADQWPVEYASDLNLTEKMKDFNFELPVDQKIDYCNTYIKKFPYNKNAYFSLAELYLENMNYSQAIDNFMTAGDLEAHDINYLQEIIKRLQLLPLTDENDITKRSNYIKELFSFIKKSKMNCNFYDAYTGFREQLPSLAELLLQKAIDNPSMPIAIQLWNRSNEAKYNITLLEEFNKASKKLKLKALPANLLIRFTNCQDVGYTHHQKYIVIEGDDGRPITYYGSCDLLARNKFDWSDHPLINTVDNQGAVSTAHGYNHAENIRRVGSSNLVAPWREVISRAEGPISLEFMIAFNERWKAKGHNTLKGMSGNKDEKSLVQQYIEQKQKGATGYEESNDQSTVVFNTTQNMHSDQIDYPWKAQLLLSTSESYTKGNVGFFKSHNIKHESSIHEAMLTAISKAERYIYIETQYLTESENSGNKLIDAIVKKVQEKNDINEPFHVYITLPYCPNGDPGGKLFVEPIRESQWATLQRCMQSIENKTGEPWNNYLTVFFFAQWEGVSSNLAALTQDQKAHTRDELLNNSYRAPVYIHSKLMVIDDSTIINGSANLNDRSLVGDRDTEIAVMQTPAPGHEAACKKAVSEFMREKILRPYFGTNTVDTLNNLSSETLAQPIRTEWSKIYFSNKTNIKNRKAQDIHLNDENIRFTFDIIENTNSDKIASLNTTPKKLYDAFLALDRELSENRKGSDYVRYILESSRKPLPEKLLLLIENAQKHPTKPYAIAFQKTYYMLFKSQSLKKVNNRTFEVDEFFYMSQKLASHFKINDLAVEKPTAKEVSFTYSDSNELPNFPLNISAKELWKELNKKNIITFNYSLEKRLLKEVRHASTYPSTDRTKTYKVACYQCAKEKIRQSLLIATPVEKINLLNKLIKIGQDLPVDVDLSKLNLAGANLTEIENLYQYNLNKCDLRNCTLPALTEENYSRLRGAHLAGANLPLTVNNIETTHTAVFYLFRENYKSAMNKRYEIGGFKPFANYFDVIEYVKTHPNGNVAKAYKNTIGNFQAPTENSESAVQLPTENLETEEMSVQLNHLESPLIVKHIQSLAMQNYKSYASNEQGNGSTSKTGKIVAFPLVMDQFGMVGKLVSGCEMIPDAPIGENGKPHPNWCWMPTIKSRLLQAAQMVNFKGMS
ncbi:MAG: phospholipase D-like domain-containing protein [Gammaproteobacteria bacterium]|nr:phospholipase D-like domain-containing protein [Gammaproteobacteria bacterium]